MSVGLKCHHGSPARIGQLSSDKCSIGWKLFCKTCYDHFPGEHTGLVWNTQMGVSSWNGCCLGYKPCRPCHFFLTVSFLSHGQWLIYPCWFSFPMLWWNVQQTAWYSVAQKLTTGWMIQFERGNLKGALLYQSLKIRCRLTSFQSLGLVARASSR